MRYYIFNLGCQMNISDSQRIATKLETLGYKPVSEKEADLIVVNACSVRQSAVDRIWGKIKNWQTANKRIILTGCLLSIDKKKFAAKGIKFFSIKNLPKLENILKHSNILQNIGISSKNYFKIRPKLDGKIAYIPIMTGCDNFCSYCVVPYTRGREKSRPMKDIINETKQALKQGAKEILLLGQNVNSYGKLQIAKSKMHNLGEPIRKAKNNSKFIKLLKEIDKLPGDFKFNFISANPHDMTSAMIDTFAHLKKWPRELHLPLQSGDDEILRKMNRRYSAKQYLELISKLKSKIPNLKISTDIIVGFPGETKKQFENTVKLCKKIGFTKAYIAQYSPRPGTAAAKLKDDVTPKEKKLRWLFLEKLINK